MLRFADANYAISDTLVSCPLFTKAVLANDPHSGVDRSDRNGIERMLS
jgi:hypothetical protein